MNVQAATTADGVNCPARSQGRSAPAPTMDPLDYLECYNAGALQFSATGPSSAFNDQVVTVTLSDILPGIEAAVANRFERDIASQLRSAYSGGSWPASPVLPYPAQFVNPTASAFKGGGAYTEGLLPL